MKKILTIVLLLSILLTAPSVLDRAKTEIGNQTYEIIVPYDEINNLSKFGIDVYKQLDERIHGVSLEPTLTLRSLEEDGHIQVYERSELSVIPELDEGLLEKRSGLYIEIKDLNEELVSRIIQTNQDWIREEPDLSTFFGNRVIFIEGFDQKVIQLTADRTEINPLLVRPLGFDMELVESIHDKGFEVVVRIANNIGENNLFILDDLLTINETFGDKKLLFSGTEVLDLSNEAVEGKMEELRDAGFVIMPIEFSPQKGFSNYEDLFGRQVVRIFSIDPFNGQGDEIGRATRAINERNIRAIYMHITSWEQFKKSPGQLEEGFDRSVKIISGIHQTMKNQKFASFVPGFSKTYPELTQPIWIKLAVAAGVSALAGLAVLSTSRLLSMVTIGGFGAIGLLYAVTGMTILAQLLALAIGIVAATYAVVSAENVQKGRLLFTYIRSLAIAFIGAWFITVLLFGNEYLVKYEEFRGVKALLVLPILLVALHFFRHSYKKVAMEPVRYFHLAILGVLMVGAAIYVMRSGNNPAVGVSGIEMVLRNGLEHVLGVRPRTKEFLIGFPLFVLALYLVSRGKAWAHYLYIGAAVGFTSMVNTFTHLHIPFYISIIRTIYSAGFGLLIGLGLIVLYRFLEAKIWPLIRERL